MNDSRVSRPSAPVWLQWTGQAVSFIALCFFALAAIVLIVVPLVTGSQTYSVLTSSMAPKYPPGTFLVVKPAEFDQLKVGDVVTFQIESGRPEVITHRITGFTASQDGERLLRTQGDNNDVADPDPVREVQVRGKLFYAVPYVGFVANALGNANRSTLVTVLAVALIAWGALTMVRGIFKDRRQKREEEIAGTESDHLASVQQTEDER
jgi:signal peptidase